MTKPDFDYDQLDAGIRDVVRRLHAQGFETTDSGDGTKAADMSCAVPWPMVACVVDARPPVRMLTERERLARVLGPEWVVTLSYDGQGPAILSADHEASRHAHYDHFNHTFADDHDQRQARLVDGLRAFCDTFRVSWPGAPSHAEEQARVSAGAQARAAIRALLDAYDHVDIGSQS